MVRRVVWGCLLLAMVTAATMLSTQSEARAAGRGQPTDWHRFYHYPYVYYPKNFRHHRGSFDHLYYRYPPNQRIPVYNENWYNFYPTERPYHKGHHFMLDVF